MSLPPLGPQDDDAFMRATGDASRAGSGGARPQPSEPPGGGYSGFGDASSRKNPLVITAFILSMLCCAPVAIVLGHMAVRAARAGETTLKPLAYISLALGYVSLGLFAILVFAGLNAGDGVGTGDKDSIGSGQSGLSGVTGEATEGSSNLDGTVRLDGPPGSVIDLNVQTSDYWWGLEVGDCIPDPAVESEDAAGNVTFAHLDPVPCDVAHHAEVFAVGRVTTEEPLDWAGFEAVADYVCAGAPFEDYVGSPYSTSEIYYWIFYPADDAFADANGEFVCVGRLSDGDLFTSIEGSGR